MKTIVDAITNKKHICTSYLRGIERSRFLLRCSLVSFSKIRDVERFKIYHVLDKDSLVDRVYHEATLMPFQEFGPNGIKVSKGYDDGQANLVICHITNLLENEQQILAQPNRALIFDGITLESLEGAICEHQGRVMADDSERFRPQVTFKKLSEESSIILTSDTLAEDVSLELGCDFEPHHEKNHEIEKLYNLGRRSASTVLLQGPDSFDLDFHTTTDKQKLYSASGSILEALAGAQSLKGGVVVFFPSYGKMVEFHNAWQKAGVFERLGVPYGRENRGGDSFKRSLHELATHEKMIFLCSIRYHKDEDLAEMVMGQVRLVLIMGLPYPFMNDTYEARLAQSGAVSFKESFMKDLAIDFVNVIIKRCLVNDFRSQRCHIVVLDDGLKKKRDHVKIFQSLGVNPTIEHLVSGCLKWLE